MIHLSMHIQRHKTSHCKVAISIKVQ